jgi:hypothetical protein
MLPDSQCAVPSISSHLYWFAGLSNLLLPLPKHYKFPSVNWFLSNCNASEFDDVMNLLIKLIDLTCVDELIIFLE